MKIVYCLNSLKYLGGIQRVTIRKANALAILGHEVYIIVTDHASSAIQIEELAKTVQLIDLKVNYYEYDWKSRLHSIYSSFVKGRIHKRKLKETIEKINPDVVVSVGQSEKYLLNNIVFDGVKIREIHFVSDYKVRTSSGLLSRLCAWCKTFYDYKINLRSYDQIILLTHEDYERFWIGSRKKVSIIPNPITVNSIVSTLDNKVVVTVARLSLEKNLISLVESFRLVVAKHPDWILKIYGEGPERNVLIGKINELNLEKNIILEGYTDNVNTQLSKGSIYVSTSLFEGFPLAIVEAISCGLPVVSYESPCGPKEILKDTGAGFLVSMNDIYGLANKINLLIEDDIKRKNMGYNALNRSRLYTESLVMRKWIDLFDRLLKEKNN